MEGLVMTPTIAGVLCCYNSERHIVATLDSIYGQSHPLDELVVVDDYSKDDTARIVNEYVRARGEAGPKVVVIRNPGNFGISMSFNIGLKTSTARYAMLLSHDDINHPRRVQRTLQGFQSGARLVCSHMSLLDSDEKVLVPQSAEMIGLNMGLANAIAAPTVALDLQTVREQRLLFNPQYDCAEDYDLWCQCLVRGLEFHVIPECLVAYRRHEGQISNVGAQLQQSLAETIRRHYVAALLPFLQASQADIFLKVVAQRHDLLASLDPGFVNAFVQLSQSHDAPENFQRIYAHMRSILAEYRHKA